VFSRTQGVWEGAAVRRSGSRSELRLLAALADGVAPPRVVARLLRQPQAGFYTALRRLEERGYVLRLRDGYRLTRRRLAFLRAEAALAKPLAR
jgi:DNA-binding IclR family transcriptional regulator